MDLSPLWKMDVSWWHLIVRSVIVYLFLIGLLRLTGKRQVGQLAPFDLVLLLVLSNAVQNSMNGGDNSIPGGIDLGHHPGGSQPVGGCRDLPQQEAGAIIEAGRRC